MSESAFLSASPGSHSHSERPNWRPGDDDIDDLLIQKIADALRDGKSERQLAKLLGLSRMRLWRAKVAARIPEPLLERLSKARRAGLIKALSMKSLAAIGRALQDGELLRGEVARCPNCGHTLRVRPDTPQAVITIVADWLEEQEARES
jgi:hypothetical protein